MIQNEIEEYNILDTAAKILSEEIRQIECQNFPVKIKTQNLIDGECEIPDKCITFCTKLSSCKNYPQRRSKKTVRLAKSFFFADFIYAVWNGRIKTSKQIGLEMTLKSLTISKKIVNILNRYGHCCSYSILEGIETEATLAACEKTDICPYYGIERAFCLRTRVAFDSFDRFVDTGAGKETLHDTVGIIFLIVNKVIFEEETNKENIEPNLDVINVEVASSHSLKRMRTFDVINEE